MPTTTAGGEEITAMMNKTQNTTRIPASRRMGHRAMMTAAFSALLLVSGGPLAGCHNRGPAATPTARARHVFFGIDASRGARRHLGGYAVTAANVAEVLHPGEDALTLFRMDRETREFSDGDGACGSAEATMATIQREVKAVSPADGTLPEKFWRTVAARAADATASHEDVVIVLASDGDNDDQRAASKQAIRAAAVSLARNLHVRAVILCGVEASNRAYLRDCFDRFGARRLFLLGPSESDPGRVTALVASAAAAEGGRS
jgi:hypothetical protein